MSNMVYALERQLHPSSQHVRLTCTHGPTKQMRMTHPSHKPGSGAADLACLVMPKPHVPKRAVGTTAFVHQQRQQQYQLKLESELTCPPSQQDDLYQLAARGPHQLQMPHHRQQLPLHPTGQHGVAVKHVSHRDPRQQCLTAHSGSPQQLAQADLQARSALSRDPRQLPHQLPQQLVHYSEPTPHLSSSRDPRQRPYVPLQQVPGTLPQMRPCLQHAQHVGWPGAQQPCADLGQSLQTMSALQPFMLSLASTPAAVGSVHQQPALLHAAQDLMRRHALKSTSGIEQRT